MPDPYQANCQEDVPLRGRRAAVTCTGDLASLSAAATAANTFPSAAKAGTTTGLEDGAIAAGEGAGWLLKSVVGVGAMHALKAGADTALANVSELAWHVG